MASGHEKLMIWYQVKLNTDINHVKNIGGRHRDID